VEHLPLPHAISNLQDIAKKTRSFIKMFAKDEHSSLPKELVNYVAKSFIALDVGLSFPNQNLYQQKRFGAPTFV
jgi:hypothetical protein